MVYFQPTIVLDPEGQTVAAGTEAVLRVKATGDSLHFQWQKNRSNLCDGGKYCDTNTDTLRILDVDKDDKGRYRCFVKNDVGEKISDEAVLTISKLVEFTMMLFIVLVCCCGINVC